MLPVFVWVSIVLLVTQVQSVTLRSAEEVNQASPGVNDGSQVSTVFINSHYIKQDFQ